MFSKKKKHKLKFRTEGKAVIVYRTTVPAEETLFPEKLKLANEMLSKAILLPR